MIQDGKAEGCELISSCESAKIATTCWNTINRKMLEPTKRDTLCPRTKKQPQQDGRRGKIKIKSNPITIGWVTHRLENNNTKEVFTLLWRFWTLHQTSQPGDPTKRLGIPRVSGLEETVGYDYRPSRGLREIETPVLEGKNKILYTPRHRGEKQWPHRRLNQNYLLVLKGLLWSQQGSPGGWGQWKVPLAWTLLECTINPTIEPVDPRAKQLQRRECNPTKQIIRLNLYWARPYPSEQDPVFPITSPSH